MSYPAVVMLILFMSGSQAPAQATCTSATEKTDCDDGFDCTLDQCRNGSCVHYAVDLACSDNTFCNGVERCVLGQGCQPGTPPCTTDPCNEGTDICGCTDSNQCNDNVNCNGTEACVSGHCVPGTRPCDDGVACTIDTCNEATLQCTHAPSNAACDDGLFCNGVETCDPLLGCLAGPSPCDDGRPCTTDTCDEATDTCVFTNNCNDGIACTDDACSDSGTCVFTPNHASCNDGQVCNGVETCDPVSGAPITGCKAGTPASCDDGLACTDDRCDPATGACTHTNNCSDGIKCTSDICVVRRRFCTDEGCPQPGTCWFPPNDAFCNDGLFCNGAETCQPGIGDPITGCLAGAPPSCNDGLGCTSDACDESTNGCTNTPSNPACDDGLFCNGEETCDPLQGCMTGPSPCDDGLPCTTDTCNEATDSCTNSLDNSQCDDGVACTDDVCGADGCQNTPNNGRCDDGQFCNGVETCNPIAGCIPGVPPCDDGLPCTDDACDEATDTCRYTNNCSDGIACTSDICVRLRICTDGEDCLEPGTCWFPPNDASCNDGLFCNGAETCQPGTGDPITGCLAGVPPVCDDGVPCTDDGCDEATDSCIYTPDNSRCIDDYGCTIDTCTSSGCTHTENDAACNDAIDCTLDFCRAWGDPGSGCFNETVNDYCDDKSFCNGAETCDRVTGCVPGTPPSCNDGLACTDDGCDPATGACTHTNNCSDGIKCTSDICVVRRHICTDEDEDCPPRGACWFPPSNASCNDHRFCNGAETCQPGIGDPITGCLAGTPPSCDDGLACTIDACDDSTNGCTNTPDNSRCDDGVACTDDVCGADGCRNTPNNGRCDDGQFCNGVETCDPIAGCLPGTPPSCDDGVPCTDDGCDEATDSCTHTPVHSQCDDGVACTDDVCDADGCRNTPNNERCDDGQFCNGVETCHRTMGCLPGTPPSCDDGLACTDDSCDGLTNACVHADNCDDAIDCTTDACTSSGCTYTENDAACDDAIDCTLDFCRDWLPGCFNVTVNDFCDDKSFCNGAEICDPHLGCVDAPDPCVGQWCDEIHDVCTPGCSDNSACPLGQVCCNGVCRNCCTNANCPLGQRCCIPTYTCRLTCTQLPVVVEE